MLAGLVLVLDLFWHCFRAKWGHSGLKRSFWALMAKGASYTGSILALWHIHPIYALVDHMPGTCLAVCLACWLGAKTPRMYPLLAE